MAGENGLLPENTNLYTTTKERGKMIEKESLLVLGISNDKGLHCTQTRPNTGRHIEKKDTIN